MNSSTIRGNFTIDPSEVSGEGAGDIKKNINNPRIK
jgi:hypothetical protein